MNKLGTVIKTLWQHVGRRFPLSGYPARGLLVLLGTCAAVFFLFPFETTFQTLNLPQVGEAAKETVIAPFTFDIMKPPDQLARERQAAGDKVLLVLDFDSDCRRKTHGAFVALKRKLALMSGRGASDTSARILHRELSSALSENAINALLKRPDLIDTTVSRADRLLEKGIAPLLLVQSREQVRSLQERYNAAFSGFLVYDKQYVTLRRDSTEATVDAATVPVREIAFDAVVNSLRKSRMFDNEELTVVYELLTAFVKPNISIANDETMLRRRKAEADVLAINGKVIKDTEIARKHQEVTPGILQKLKSLRLSIERMDNAREQKKIKASNAARFLLVSLLLLFLGIYLWRFQPTLVKNTRHLCAFALILIVQIAIIRGSLFLVPKIFESNGDVVFLMPEYVIPLSVGATLAAILFGQNQSFLITLFTSAFFGIVLGFNQYLFLFSFLGGIAGGIAARNIRYRWEFFKIIPGVLGSYFICILLWEVISFKPTLLSFFQNAGLAAANVGISLFLAMTLVPIFEYFFDITTGMSLIELSDMNHPVLKRLSIEGAGTYNHSVLVGNLAESAALAIGANPLLSRVASYYHDIGKIPKADYFVENVLSIDKQRHNKLSPNMSALIILAHIKDGLELARKYRLPRVIHEVIAQHHGTSRVSFFYEKALEQDPHKQVQEQDFRYPGPVPQTREAAIIMLADSVEAASRSLGTSSPKLLRELVKKIIRDKFMGGQLDQCDLTLRDLDGIVEGFMPILQGMFHSRIAYPEK